jgi:hypothetical protein
MENKRHVTVVLNEEDAEVLREIAHRKRTSKSGFLRHLFIKFLEGESNSGLKEGQDTKAAPGG